MFKTANGYLFAILGDANARLARIDVRYPVGSADDPAGKEGLAHLAEHLLYEFDLGRNGSTTSLTAEYGRLSSYYNASTAADYIHFEAQGLPSALPELLQLEADRATASCNQIQPIVFEREKEVVLNELRERLGANGADLRSDFHKALYPVGHAYRRVGSVASVATITQEDVCTFLQNQFRRGRATVIISGNVNAAEVRQAVNKSFSAIPSRLVDSNPQANPVPAKSSKTTIRADVNEGVFMLAWPLPAQGTTEYRFLQMGRGAMAGRLGSFASTYGWGHGARTWIAGGGDAPMLILEVTLRSMKHVSDATDAAAKSVQHAFRTLKRSGQERDSRAWQIRMASRQTKLLAQYETLGSRAHMYSDYFLYEDERSLLIAKLEELETASPGGVRTLAERWLDPSKASVIIIEPDVQSSGKLSVGDVFASAHTNAHGVKVDPSDADRPVDLPEGPAGLALTTTRYEMSNGLRVVLWNQGTMPLIHGRLVTSSGSAMDPKGAEGIAAFSGFDDVYEDSMVYWNRKVNTMIDALISDILFELRLPGRSVSKELKKHLRSRFALRGSAEVQDFRQRMRVALFGSAHPYARNAMTLQSIESMNRDRSLGWARKHIVPRNSTFILAGNFDIEEARAWINYRVDHVDGGSDSPRISERAKSRGPAWIGGKGRENSPTVDLDVRFLGSRGIDSKYAARLVLASILGSKLAKLRQQHAITYGVSADYTMQEAGGYYQITGSVDASRAKQAGRLVQAAIDEIRKGPENYRSEFVLARRKQVNALLASSSDSRAIANRLENIARYDLSDEFYEWLVHRIARLTLDDIQKLVATELAAKQQITGAFGRPTAVTDFLEGAGGHEAPPSTP